MIPITSDQVYDWHPGHRVDVYSADKKCLQLCQVKDLDLTLGDALRARKLRARQLEPVDENLQLCKPQEREIPPNCVGGRHCSYPETCYRFETEQQNHECNFPTAEELEQIRLWTEGLKNLQP
ncbi:hypothetical protein [Microcoleus sp. B9-D4]|uniref:hypothetical protein n=1 Tax=Microcoleus sp. B9-D4 TaxID=2818711 RepID=UPI002FD3D3CA